MSAMGPMGHRRVVVADCRERRVSFEARVGEARAAVEGVFARVGEREREDMVQSVWERGWEGYERTLARAALVEAGGRRFDWVGWMRRIARNLLTDAKRRERSLAASVGRAERIERSLEWWERRMDAYGRWTEGAVRVRLVDESAAGTEEEVAWEETRRALRECVDQLSIREWLVLWRWGVRPNDRLVGKELGVSAATARRARIDGLGQARRCLEAKGLTAENRGRQTDGGGWSFGRRWAPPSTALRTGPSTGLRANGDLAGTVSGGE